MVESLGAPSYAAEPSAFEATEAEMVASSGETFDARSDVIVDWSPSV